MKKTLFCILILSCTVTLPSCAWQEEEQIEPSEMATKGTHENNIIYLHEYQTRFGSSQEAFRSLVNRGNVVVDFYADWCPPCKKLGGTIEQIASNFSDITFLKVNVDHCKEVSTGIRSIPVLAFYKNGQEVKRVTGAQTKNELIKLLQTIY